MLLYITVDRYVAEVYRLFMHAYINMGLGLP